MAQVDFSQAPGSLVDASFLTLTAEQRAQMFANGVETIVEGGGVVTWTSYAEDSSGSGNVKLKSPVPSSVKRYPASNDGLQYGAASRAFASFSMRFLLRFSCLTSVLLLGLSAPVSVWAASGDCATGRDEIADKIDAIAASASDQAERDAKSSSTRDISPADPAAGKEKLEACVLKLKQLGLFCSSAQVHKTEDCQWAAVGEKPHDASDHQISVLVAGANCKRGIGSCYKNGSNLKYRPSLADIVKACADDIDARLIQMKNIKRDKAELFRLKAAKAIHKATQQIFDEQTKCNEKKAEEYEKLAQDALRAANLTRSSDQRGKYSISCLDRRGLFRMCAYTAGGPRKLEVMEDDDHNLIADVHNDAPAYVGNSTGHCSGHCLSTGKGCNEVMTAGHCVNEPGPVDITVYDKDSMPRPIRATSCSTNFTEDDKSLDYAVCRLSQSVNANPVYLATVDPSIQGERCEDSGYVMRCGPQFFAALSRTPVFATIFPGGSKLSFTRGQLYGDLHIFYHDMLTAPGASGSGMITVRQSDGRMILLGAQGYGNVYEIGGQGVPVDYNTWKQLQANNLNKKNFGDGSFVSVGSDRGCAPTLARHSFSFCRADQQ